MIELSPEHTTLFMVLTIIGCIAISRLCIRIIMKSLRNIKAINANNKEFRSKVKAKEEMQAKGEYHEWIRIPYGTEERLVCKKTGWCPTINGFLAMGYVNSWVERLGMEKEYNKYSDARVKLLAEDYEMPTQWMEDLIEKVFKIKKDFHVEKMKDSVAEMKDLFGEPEDEVGKDK